MPKTAAATKNMPVGTMKRFSVSQTCDGYEVTDRDGRPVTNSHEFANEPLEIAANLNDAAAVSPDALRLALGGVYESDEAELDAMWNDELDDAELNKLWA